MVDEEKTEQYEEYIDAMNEYVKMREIAHKYAITIPIEGQALQLADFHKMTQAFDDERAAQLRYLQAMQVYFDLA